MLVVGASATGVQLADEIHASGRPVTLAVGRHTRLPRVYRGRDILWWLDAMGVFDETVRPGLRPRGLAPPAVAPARRPARPRDARPAPRSRRRGVRLVGRAVGVEGGRVVLRRRPRGATPLAADAKLGAPASQRIDVFAARTGLDAEVGPPEPFQPLSSGRRRRRPRSTCGPRASAPSSGRRAIRRAVPVAQGARARRARRDPARRAASRPPPGSTCSASTSCAGASRASSTAWASDALRARRPPWRAHLRRAA